MSPAIKTRKTPKTPKTRVCASREGQKAGPHTPIVIGQVIGFLKVTGRAPNDKKSRCVYVECSSCGGNGKCRFVEFLNGTAKSCRCLRDAAFENNQTGFANAISAERVSRIFTDISQGMGQDEIAAKHRIQSFTVRFVKDRVYRQLDGYMTSVRTAIYELAQLNVKAAMAQHSLSRAEVLALCAIHRQQTAQAVVSAVTAVTVTPPAKESIRLWNKLDPFDRSLLLKTRGEATAVMDRICGLDVDGPVEETDLLLPCEMKMLKKFTSVVKRIAEPTHAMFGGLSLKTKAILIESQNRNFERMKAGMIARHDGKVISRRRSRSKDSKQGRWFQFESYYGANALVQAFDIMHDMGTAA
jgi:hypothetical protein